VSKFALNTALPRYLRDEQERIEGIARISKIPRRSLVSGGRGLKK